MTLPTNRAPTIAEWVNHLPVPDREAYFAELTPDETVEHQYDWYGVHARPEQQIPEGDDWNLWMTLAGRGWGKTRTGAEFTIHEVVENRWTRIALVARTPADVRDTMIQGESGILACSRPEFMPVYEPSKRLLTWPNGARALCFSAQTPDQLRGLAFDGFWGDEPATWPVPLQPGELSAFQNLMFCLRRGIHPRGVLTTTPKMSAELRSILARPDIVVTGGSTYENRDNLAANWINEIIALYEGTRLGLQEIYATLLEDNPDALWQYKSIEQNRTAHAPKLARVVVGVDPEAASNETSAETGIVVAGRGFDRQLYVLDDFTIRGQPLVWAKRVVDAYHQYEADHVTAESNNGGEMVAAVIHAVDATIPVRLVHATRGKVLRAEPIATIYDRGRAHHVGAFVSLESQMCVTGDTLVATALGPRRIDTVRVGDLVWTRTGLRPVLATGCTAAAARVYRLDTSDFRHLLATEEHPVYTAEAGFVPVWDLQRGYTLEDFAWPNHVNHWANTDRLSTGRGATTPPCGMGTIVTPVPATCSTVTFGKPLMARYPPVGKSTTATAIRGTTTWPTWSRLPAPNTQPATPHAAIPGLRLPSDPIRCTPFGRIPPSARASVSSVGRLSPHPANGWPPVLPIAGACSKTRARAVTISRVVPVAGQVPVYNLTVAGAPEFYANGILIHNCQWMPGERSPDRLDALVWAAWDLMVGAGHHGRPVASTPKGLGSPLRLPQLPASSWGA